jgi:hypothetical protein
MSITTTQRKLPFAEIKYMKLPTFPFRFIAILSYTLFVNSLYSTQISLGDEIGSLVIENAPDRIKEGEIKAQLRGARIVTTSPLFLESTPLTVTVPKSVVIEAISGYPELKDVFNDSDDHNNAKFVKAIDSIKLKKVKSIGLESSRRIINGSYCSISNVDDNIHFSCDDNTKYNAEDVAQLVINGGLDENNITKQEVDGHKVDFIGVLPNYASVLLAGNQAARKLANQKRAPTIYPDTTALRDAMSNADKNIDVMNAAFLQSNDVTFGMPLVENSTDAQLHLPKQVSNKFDVYLIQFAMTWHDLPRNDLDELGFSVKLLAGTIALALMPFRYGVEVTEKAEAKIAPEIEAEGVKVSLGEVYGREISFSYLKPTIRAYGLQESEFSWTMRDQAIQPGAEQFVCVVGVPKQSKQITLQVSAFTQWSGGWSSAAGIESTDEKIMQVSLQ